MSKIAQDSGAELNSIAIPSYNMMQNYNHVLSQTEPFIKRSYEGYKWYYIVVKPFDLGYKTFADWFQSDKFQTNVARALWNIDPDMEFITVKEKCSAKHHLNIICVTDVDMMKHHDRNKYRARWHVQQLPTLGDRYRTLEYMIKESKVRYFYQDIDYYLDYETQVSNTSCYTFPNVYT